MRINYGHLSMGIAVILVITLMLSAGCGSSGGNSGSDKQSANQAKNQAGQDANQGQEAAKTCNGVVCPTGNICVVKNADGKYSKVGFNTESGIERCCVGGSCMPDVNIVPGATLESSTPTATP